jgi:aryl-alcohol dehydrogenase-like predicted oxidoreductase
MLERLGDSEIRISRTGIGVWQASGEWKGNDGEIIRAVEKAHELGVNLVDTAEAYGDGHSEEVLGQALRKIGREGFVVATKVNGPHLRYEELQKACKASMARLGVTEIDLYQVHWPDPWEQIPLKQTMKALEKLYGEGKIRAIGVSNFAVRDLEEAQSYLSKTGIVSNQLRYNLLQREIDEEVLPYCEKNGITVLAYSPLAQGALTGKYSSKSLPKGDVREANKLFTRHNMGQVEKLNSILSTIAAKHSVTTGQVALAWLTSNKLVVPIPGAKNAAQAEENLRGGELRLSAREKAEIEKGAAQVKIDYF